MHLEIVRFDLEKLLRKNEDRTITDYVFFLVFENKMAAGGLSFSGENSWRQ
jgi:hypothetical protein